MRRWRDWSDAAPDEHATACVIVTAPPEPFVPAGLRGKPVLGVAALYAGDPDEGADVLQPLRELGPAVDQIGPMPYTAFQAALDPLAPWGLPFYARGEYMRALGDAAIDTFLARGPELIALGHPLSQMVIFRIGQAVSALPDDASAFSHRDARYLFHPISGWADPADAERVIEANRAFASAMAQFGTGAPYLNFTPEPDRVRDGYGDAKYARLVELKDAYDPTNLFRLNQNIRPTQRGVEVALA
jgi:FAD/FMN-containing dehydrogenase